MTALTAWWQARTPRERGLLLVMFALLAVVIAWLLVVRPLSDSLDSAKRRHAEAVTALAEARGRAEAVRRQGQTSAAPPLPIDSFVSRTSTEAGFANARIAGQGPTQATIAIDAARAQAFFAWVRLMEARGLRVESLRARANPDQTLAVEAAFRARR